jgi:hypothetical protein
MSHLGGFWVLASPLGQCQERTRTLNPLWTAHYCVVKPENSWGTPHWELMGTVQNWRGRLIQPPNGSLIRRPHRRLNHDKVIEHPTLHCAEMPQCGPMRHCNVDPIFFYYKLSSIKGQKFIHWTTTANKPLLVPILISAQFQLKNKNLYTGRQQQTSCLFGAISNIR